MSDCSICQDAVIDYPAPEGTVATGSHRTSCGHVYHPKCIWKWYSKQEKGTCPMCRNAATEMEDLPGSSEDEEEDEEDEDDEEDERVLGILARADAGEFDGGGVIRLSRASLEYILRDFGGVGMTAGVEAEVEINEFNEVMIERFELERILQEQGGTPLSDAQWTQLISVYPPAEHNDDEVVAGAMAMVAPPQLTFAPSADEQPDPTQRARELLANPAPPASVVTPEDMEAWEIVLDAARATIARHAAAARHHSSEHSCPLELFAAGETPPSYFGHSVVCDTCGNSCGTVDFYHCVDCGFDICQDCFTSRETADAEAMLHWAENRATLGRTVLYPLDEGEEEDDLTRISRIVLAEEKGAEPVELPEPKFTFRRADIERILRRHGSTATMVEFFNEEDAAPGEETLVVTMTVESLNNRLVSLCAVPASFEEVMKERLILNPEDDPILGSC